MVLGISKDTVESHKKFKKKHGLNFPLLADPDLKVLKAYGAWGKKMMYGKEVKGTSRTTYIINEKGKIAKVFPKVKVKGHIREVLDSL